MTQSPRMVLRRLYACDAGVSVVEMAIVLPTFLMFLFGIVKFSLALWAQGSMYYAVQAASRCYSIDSTDCGSIANAETYATAHYYGPSPASVTFTASATGCGHTVSASYTYSISIPFAGSYSLPLSASACFP